MTSRVKEFDEELDENFERKGVEGWVTNNRKRGSAAQALRKPLASGPEQCRTHEQGPSRNDVNKFGKFDTFRNSVRPEIEHTSSFFFFKTEAFLFKPELLQCANDLSLQI